MSGALIVCIENDAAILDGMKTLLRAWDAEVIAVGRSRSRHRGDRGRRQERSPDFWSTIISTAATGVAAIRDIRRRFGESIPAILITADRSPHVRAAAREEKIAVLNKPVKPASLRALLGQWRTQQMVAAE